MSNNELFPEILWLLRLSRAALCNCSMMAEKVTTTGIICLLATVRDHCLRGRQRRPTHSGDVGCLMNVNQLRFTSRDEFGLMTICSMERRNISIHRWQLICPLLNMTSVCTYRPSVHISMLPFSALFGTELRDISRYISVTLWVDRIGIRSVKKTSPEIPITLHWRSNMHVLTGFALSWKVLNFL